MQAARRRISRLAGATATLLALVVGGLLIVPAVLGMHRYVITGGSMQGTIDRGALVFDDDVPVTDLKRGDVITYHPPKESGIAGLVTHRIVWTGRGADGAPAFRTKGDANATADPWTFTLTAPRQARVAFSIPLVGYGLAGLSDPRIRFILVGVPALLLGAGLARRLWHDDGRTGHAAA